MSEQDQTKYASYNSLKRKPLIGGVPVILLVFSLMATLMSTMLGYWAFGKGGLVIPALILLFLLYVKIRCSVDSRATDDMLWDLKGLFIRLQCQSRIVSFTSIDESSRRRKEDVSEWLKNNTIDRKTTKV